MLFKKIACTETVPLIYRFCTEARCHWFFHCTVYVQRIENLVSPLNGDKPLGTAKFTTAHRVVAPVPIMLFQNWGKICRVLLLFAASAFTLPLLLASQCAPSSSESDHCSPKFLLCLASYRLRKCRFGFAFRFDQHSFGFPFDPEVF